MSYGKHLVDDICRVSSGSRFDLICLFSFSAIVIKNPMEDVSNAWSTTAFYRLKKAVKYDPSGMEPIQPFPNKLDVV